MKFRLHGLWLFFIFINLWAVQGLASDINATIVDTSGTSTDITGIHLYWQSHGLYYIHKSIEINVGDADIKVPFDKIKSMEFDWSLEPPVIKLTSIDGKIMIGTKRKNLDRLWFNGKTSSGKFSLPLRNTSKIIFDIN
jgi:hypothetical protein